MPLLRLLRFVEVVRRREGERERGRREKGEGY